MNRHLQREFELLKKSILALGALVEESVVSAVRAVAERDLALARRVTDGDIEIDRAEVEVEEDCLKILALYQPVAADLRFVIAVLKINNDLERIGDLAVNIAEQALNLSEEPARAEIPLDLRGLAERAQAMLKKALDALVRGDLSLARDVVLSDDEVDALHRRTYERVQAALERDPAQAKFQMHHLSVSRYLERIADYATNIAEDVFYMREGEIIRHKYLRPDGGKEPSVLLPHPELD